MWKKVFGGCALVVGIAAVGTCGVTDYFYDCAVPRLEVASNADLAPVRPRENVARSEIFPIARAPRPKPEECELFVPHEASPRKEIIQIDPVLQEKCREAVIRPNLVKSKVVPMEEGQGVVVRSEFGMDYEESEPARFPPNPQKENPRQLDGPTWTGASTFGLAFNAAFGPAVTDALAIALNPVTPVRRTWNGGFGEEQEVPGGKASTPEDESKRYMYHEEDEHHHHGSCPYLNGHTPYCPRPYHRPFRKTKSETPAKPARRTLEKSTENQQGENRPASNEQSKANTQDAREFEGSWSGAWLYGEPCEVPEEKPAVGAENFPWHMLIPLSW